MSAICTKRTFRKQRSISAIGGKKRTSRLRDLLSRLTTPGRKPWSRAIRSAATTNPATLAARGCPQPVGRAETCARPLSATGLSRFFMFSSAAFRSATCCSARSARRRNSASAGFDDAEDDAAAVASKASARSRRGLSMKKNRAKSYGRNATIETLQLLSRKNLLCVFRRH